MSLDLDAIDARAKAATDGPWVATHHIYVDADHGMVTLTAEEGDTPNEHQVATTGADAREVAFIAGPASADANFIAHARADVPALVAEVRRLQAALANAIIAHSDMAKALGVNQ